jgi:hypothetical protein
MSKRQEKIERAKDRAENYLVGQTAYQGVRILIMMQRAFETGLHMYENNKASMSQEDIDEVERMKSEQEAQLNQLKENLGLPLDWHYSMLQGGPDEPIDTTTQA